MASAAQTALGIIARVICALDMAKFVLDDGGDGLFGLLMRFDLDGLARVAGNASDLAEEARRLAVLTELLEFDGPAERAGTL